VVGVVLDFSNFEDEDDDENEKKLMKIQFTPTGGSAASIA